MVQLVPIGVLDLRLLILESQRNRLAFVVISVLPLQLALQRVPLRRALELIIPGFDLIHLVLHDISNVQIRVSIC